MFYIRGHFSDNDSKPKDVQYVVNNDTSIENSTGNII